MRLTGLAATGGLCALVLAACHPGAGAPKPIVTALPGPMLVVQRAETGPITAIAGHAPSVWAAGAPGLRRWDVTSGDWELVGGERLAGRRITALAADDDGNAWVAISGEVGRFTADKRGDWHYQATGSPGEVMALAARAPGKGGGAWAGGPGGLFRYDGHRWLVVDGLDGAGVGWLGIDAEGTGVWVATTGRGLYHADDRGVAPAGGGAGVEAPEIVGLASTAAGTRVVAGNMGGDGHREGRLYVMTMDRTIELDAPPGVAVRALVERGGDAVLIAGPAGGERAYHLQPLAPGQAVPAGGLRFSAPDTSSARERWAALPIELAVPPGVTRATTAGGEIYCGTAALGVARAAAGQPDYLQGSQLVGDAEHFSVACLAADHCLVVTEAGRAWRTDGVRYEPAVVSGAASEILGVVADARGGVYAISSESPWHVLTVTRREPSRDSWSPSARVAIDLPPRTTPELSFVAVSPAGTLWAGLRASSGGDDVGYGAIELDLQTGQSVQHHPRRAGEKLPVEALPLPADLEAVMFDGGATWFASLSGVFRFQQGQLENWGEAEGLPSELVWGIARASDGTVVAGTSEGPARFDGHAFRPFGGEGFAVHGLATDSRGTLWAATSKGLRPVAIQAGKDAGKDALAHAPEMVSGNLRDVTADPFGRVWALTTNAIAVAQLEAAKSEKVNLGRRP